MNKEQVITKLQYYIDLYQQIGSKNLDDPKLVQIESLLTECFDIMEVET
jgi:hypothetical protein